MKLKILTAMAGHAAGATITVKDIGGVPTDPFWRRRIRDAEIDGCVEVKSNRSAKK